MSFTLTSTAEGTSRIYLTPSKRPRLPDGNYSVRELHSWTFSAESIAPCTVHDVLNMRRNTSDDYDFFWLGRVPCRSVKIVGIVVGVQVYERKITYTIDDGTGVVDCVHLHRPAKSPSKIKPKYKPIGTEKPPEPLNPVAEIGQTIRVTGAVRAQYRTRVISANEINQCASPNEEILHSRLVQKLRRTNYFATEPFTLPKRTQKFTDDSPIIATPKSSTTIPDPPSSVFSSPIKSSPIKDHDANVISSSPLKLRHPSRLRTRDLTENTFRIYLKRYMDYTATTCEYEPDITIQTSLDHLPATPTKRSRVVSQVDTPCRATPRASFTTPKANLDLYQKYQLTSTERPRHEGFTISYLRRVPELSLLAYRVVQTVANRQEREKRKRSKDAMSSSKLSLPSSVTAIPPGKFAGKIKRLFEWAIIQLLQEGCIILWDGPIRPLPDSKITDTTRLWKPTSTSVSIVDDKGYPDDDPTSGYISDPQPNEESYISLSPAHLSEPITEAIRFLVEVEAGKGKPYMGATADGILRVLKKDDRWRNIGIWNVQDALELLKAQGAVWDLGKGSWDLTA